MSAPTLECPICGGVAFTFREFREGLWWAGEGDSDRCETCQHPGNVCFEDDLDEGGEHYWTAADECWKHCNMKEHT